MKSLRFAFLLALGAAVTSAPAMAWPYLDVTSTETLSIDPLRVRTTFTITEVGFRPIYGEILVMPLDHGTTRLYECGAAPPLNCYYVSSSSESGAVLEVAADPVGTYWIVSDQVAPCVRFQFIDILLGGHLNPIYAPDIDACLSEDMPVPAHGMSWGSLKATYR